jgi:hypothetical protein
MKVTDKKVVNLTAYDLWVYGVTESGRTILEKDVMGKIPATRRPCHIPVITTQLYEIESEGGGVIPIFSSGYGAPVNLPDPENGVLFIVPRVVGEAIKQFRKDILVISGKLWEDKKNQRLGIRGLAIL